MQYAIRTEIKHHITDATTSIVIKTVHVLQARNQLKKNNMSLLVKRVSQELYMDYTSCCYLCIHNLELCQVVNTRFFWVGREILTHVVKI